MNLEEIAAELLDMQVKLDRVREAVEELRGSKKAKGVDHHVMSREQRKRMSKAQLARYAREKAANPNATKSNHA